MKLGALLLILSVFFGIIEIVFFRNLGGNQFVIYNVGLVILMFFGAKELLSEDEE